MLRSVLLTACLLVFGLGTRAQHAQTKEEFQAYFTALNKQQQALSAAQQYRPALALYAKWHRAYDQLVPATKQDFSASLPSVYYNEACYYSLLHDRANATRYLQYAIEHGYRNYQHATVDRDFDFVRSDAGFQQQLTALRAKGDYRYILQQAGPYAAPASTALPAFTYQKADDAHFVALRKRYKLDSIAGNESDAARLINLMHWVHNQVPHNGNIDNPALRNAQDLLTVCQREKRGLNCRGLATVLNEVYLAMGYPSRFVTCLPKDTTDFDCHVINSVYSPSQHQWLWMDPTNDAYVMNEQGSLLSIEEVRARLIDGRPLLLSPTANWNHRQTTTKEEYLDNYMAKNLYQLECSLTSQYDLETRQGTKALQYVRLLPASAQTSAPAPRTHQVGTITFTNYATSSPAAFWQNP